MNISRESEQLDDYIEIVKDKLYMTFRTEEKMNEKISSNQFIQFINDKSLIYTSFFADFGPLDLGLTVKFCQQLHEVMNRAKEVKKAVLYICKDHPHARSNSAVLICAYQIFVLNSTIEESYKPFIGIDQPFIPFRDAGFCINTFPITVLDCARAMKRAKSLCHFNYKTFSVQNFHNIARLQNGDVSWIVPSKFIAFSGPLAKRRQISTGSYTLTPEEYVPLFKSLGVSCVVRFNSKCYDRNVFTMNGIRHIDLFYEDGGNPSEAILQAFLQVCENERGAIAVHCKAGLGRTGTNIAAYMMKHFGYSARESIAWCRLCRPGSIVGPQQQYLASIESKMFSEGNLYRERNNITNTNQMNNNDATKGKEKSNENTHNSNSAENQNRSSTPALTVRGAHNKAVLVDSLFRKVSKGDLKENNNNSQLNSKSPLSESMNDVPRIRSQSGTGEDHGHVRPSTSGGQNNKKVSTIGNLLNSVQSNNEHGQNGNTSYNASNVKQTVPKSPVLFLSNNSTSNYNNNSNSNSSNTNNGSNIITDNGKNATQQRPGTAAALSVSTNKSQQRSGSVSRAFNNTPIDLNNTSNNNNLIINGNNSNNSNGNNNVNMNSVNRVYRVSSGDSSGATTIISNISGTNGIPNGTNTNNTNPTNTPAPGTGSNYHPVSASYQWNVDNMVNNGNNGNNPNSSGKRHGSAKRGVNNGGYLQAVKVSGAPSTSNSQEKNSNGSILPISTSAVGVVNGSHSNTTSTHRPRTSSYTNNNKYSYY
eukprot:gene4615-6493_t